MFLTWLTFWEPVEERFRVGFFALLTVVATHTLISNSLPRLNYLTLSDVILITCYVVAATVIVNSIFVRRIREGGAPERAARIDARTRLLLPAAAFAALIISLWILW